VNFSFFLLVGVTSPLTVNVVGYLKTVIVFVGGYLLFDKSKQKELDYKNILGIATVLLGVLWYTMVKIDQANAEQRKKREAAAEQKV
jgi:solute carrier family 35, member E3